MLNSAAVSGSSSNAASGNCRRSREGAVTRLGSRTRGVHARGGVNGHVHVPFPARDRNHVDHDRKLALHIRPLHKRLDARVFTALLGLGESSFEALVAVMGKVAGLESRHPDQRDRMPTHFGDVGAVGIVHVQMAELLSSITTQKIAHGKSISFPVIDELPFDDFVFRGLGPFFGQGFRGKGLGQLGASLLRIRACQPVDL